MPKPTARRNPSIAGSYCKSLSTTARPLLEEPFLHRSLGFAPALLLVSLLTGCSLPGEKPTLSMPTNGNFQTLGPLDAYTTYRLLLKSPADLSPAYIKEATGFLQPTKWKSLVEIDGHATLAYSKSWDGDQLRALEFVHHGTGEEVQIAFSHNRSSSIPVAEIQYWPESPPELWGRDSDAFARVLFFFAVSMAVCAILVGLVVTTRPAERTTLHQPRAPRSSRSSRTTNPSPPNADYRVRVRAHGREEFTRVLEKGVRYRFHLCGTFTFGGKTGTSRTGDSFYYRDDLGNFRCPLAGFRLDGKLLDKVHHHLVDEDRELHTYIFEIDGPGRKVSLALRPPNKYLTSQGEISAFIRKLADVPTLAQQEERARHDKERLGLEARVKKMVVMSRALENWASPDFRKAVAKKRGRELLNSRADVVSEFGEIFCNEPLVAYLTTHHPELIHRLDGHLEAYLEAERLSVQERPRLTTREVRSIMVGRLQVQMDDKKAKLLTGLKSKERFEQELEEFELTDGERDELIEEMNAEVANHLEAETSGGNGDVSKKATLLK